MRGYYNLFSDKVIDAPSNVARIGREEFLEMVGMLETRLPSTFEPWVQVSQQGESITIERYLIKIVGTQMCFLLPYSVRDGLFFFLERPILLSGDEISAFNNWRSGRTYPNYIRTPKPSKRQLTEWVDYFKEEERLFIEHLNKCRQEKADFLKSIEGYKVYSSEGNTKGEIEKNGIVFEFFFERGVVYTKIKLAYNVGASLESFKGLSDNKWIKGL